MPSFPGYTLPDELRMLAEQIRRFVQEEIIPAEQRVEPLTPQGEQQIEAVDLTGQQDVGEGTKSDSRRAAETAGKVVLGVFAAAIALAAAAASLLLL